MTAAMWRTASVLSVAGVCLFGASGGVGAAAEVVAVVHEFDVRIAYDFNFGRFMTWPENVSSNAVFEISIYDQEIADRARDLLKGRTIRGREVLVSNIDKAEAPAIVSLSGMGEDAARAEIRRLRGQPVLTVGDQPGFIEWGGMVRFLELDGRLRFEMNPEAIAVAKLKPSAQLLEVAKIRHGGQL